MLGINNKFKKQHLVVINQKYIPAIYQEKVNNQNPIHARVYLKDVSHLLHVDLNSSDNNMINNMLMKTKFYVCPK